MRKTLENAGRTKKLKRLIAAFTLVGGVAAAVVGLSGCKRDNSNLSDYGGGQVTFDEEQDKRFTVAKNVTQLVISGEVQSTIQLNKNYASHSVKRDAIIVYFGENTGGVTVLCGEVPSSNYELTLTDPEGNICTDWNNLRGNGDYILSVSLKDCKSESGANLSASDITGEFKITVINEIVPTALTVKEGAVLTQPKSKSDKMTAGWKYAVYRMNGDEVEVPAESVEVSGLDTYTVTDGATATLSCGDYTGTVTYAITENPDLHSRSYAVNFAKAEVGEVPSGFKFLDGMDVEISVECNAGGATVFSSIIKSDDRYFRGGLCLSGEQSRIKISAKGETKITVFRRVNGAGGEVTGEVESVVMSFPEEGVYYLQPSEGTSMDLFFMRVDTEVEDAASSDLEYDGGEPELVELSVKKKTADFKQRFSSGATFSVSANYSFVGVYAAANDCKMTEKDVTEGLDFTIGGIAVVPDETVLTAELFHDFGEVTVTVEKEGVTSEYTVVIERPEVTGVDLKVMVNGSFDTRVFSVEESLILKKSDLSVYLAGGASADFITERITCRPTLSEAEYEVTQAGLPVSVGEYEIKVYATVIQGYAQATLTAVCQLSVTADATLEDVSVGPNVIAAMSAGNLRGDTVLASSRSGRIYITATSSKPVTVQKDVREFYDVKYTKSINTKGAGGADGRSVAFEVKAACTIVLYVSTASEYVDVTLNVMTTEGVLGVRELDGSYDVVRVIYSIQSAGTYYIGTESGSVNVYDAEIIYE